jgi:hypothetical protein
MENNIPLLSEILDDYEKGTLDLKEAARKCYLTERERAYNKVTWIHNDELKSHSLLRRLSGNNAKDILKNTKLI